MQVKICGITSLEDAWCAINNGADAIGFVFHKTSPRYISALEARDIIVHLPPFIQKVGLFTTHLSEEINTIMQTAKLSLSQIHNKVDSSFLSKINYPYIEVLRVKSIQDLNAISSNKYYLVDSFVDSFGGEGKRLDLDIFSNKDCSKFILAGGLNSNNLESIKDFNFYGVDVSSGVESSPGVKEHKKIREFIKVAKNITRNY